MIPLLLDPELPKKSKSTFEKPNQARIFCPANTKMTSSCFCVCLLAAQQSGEVTQGEGSTSAEAAAATSSPAADSTSVTTQSRAITTVTQATPTPGPSVPVSGLLLNVVALFVCLFA